MPLIQLIVLAIIQGVTEFLPVSSSAHLILAPLLVENWQDQGPLIDVAAHVGSLFAVILYFRRETAMLTNGAFDTLLMRATENRQLFFHVAMATVPILLVGAIVAFGGWLDDLRSPRVIGTAFIVFGLFLWHGDRQPERKIELRDMTWRDALMVGGAQIIAIIPGSSRSGVTMTAARYLGWSRTQAARFSMLIAIPTISASGLFAVLSLVRDGAQANMISAAIVAALSFLAALGAIAVFMKMTKSMSFTPFVIYRIVVGLFLLIYFSQAGAATGVME